MPVLDRSALVDSPLADLHAIASELSIDGYRRLRRADLIDAILAKQGGAADSVEDATGPGEDGAPASETRRRRGRRGGRGRGPSRDAGPEGEEADEANEGAGAEAQVASSTGEASAIDDASAGPATPDAAPTDGAAGTAPRPRRSRDTPRPKAESEPREDRPGRSRRRAKADEEEPEAPVEEVPVAGVVELLPNGSGFVRVAGPDPSDDDVYISSAQVKRCELVSGDAITGPKRSPRRSERFASLIRIETINGRPASELADSVRFDDLPAAFPSERLKVGSEDPTLKAIEWLTPFGLGSRVTIVGASRAGKTEALRRLAAVFAEHEELTVSVALAGARPEEITEWSAGPIVPAAAVSLAASEDAQSGAVEPVVDQARRLAARGAHAVVLIDSLDGLSPHTARKVIAGARNIVDGGSVTIIATATAPIGGETTVIALDVGLTSVGRFPALDLVASGTLRPELLVGDAGAEAIARTRAEVSEGDES